MPLRKKKLFQCDHPNDRAIEEDRRTTSTGNEKRKAPAMRQSATEEQKEKKSFQIFHNGCLPNSE